MSTRIDDLVFQDATISKAGAEQVVGADEVSEMRALYRLWHKKEPTGIRSTVLEIPDRVVCVGQADSILYYSDKWENDGDGFNYTHKFDSHPNVYFPPGFETVGKSVSTERVSGIDPNGRVGLTFLAVVRRLRFSNGRDHRWELRVPDDDAALFSTSDMKTLVIVTRLRGYPFFALITGGRMEVTARGIVH